jgi:hypothetical protein
MTTVLRNCLLPGGARLEGARLLCDGGNPEDRLMVVSLGTETPTCTEVSEDCLAKSRRVETLIESKPIVSR